MRRRHILVLLLVGACVALATQGATMPQPPSPTQTSLAPNQAAMGERALQQVAAAVHVHTKASTGAYDLSTLSNVARNEGVDVVVLGENLQLEFRYGPWPLRYFYEVRRVSPSLRQHGVRTYLEELEKLQSNQRLPMYLPGVEVMPHYFWTGTLAGEGKTLHNVQRNMLVVIPPSANAATTADATESGVDFLRGLPAIGNPGGERHGIRSLVLFLPGAVLLGYGVRRTLPRRSRVRISLRGLLRALIGGDQSKLPLSEVAFRLLLIAGGLYLIVHNYPYSYPLHSNYDREAGLAPYQDLIDYSQQRGGLVYWSMPEASDYQDMSFGPVAVRLSTHPHPAVVSTSSGHTGFGGVYADNVTLLDAGGAWDESLISYCRGERSTPPWTIGEGAFHYTGQAGKRLSDVLTMVWVEAPTRGEVFDSLASGRSYAVRQSHPESLRLRELTLADPRSGLRAWPGETLDVRGANSENGLAGGRVELDLVVEMYPEPSGSTPVTVEIVRQGKLYQRWEATAPFRRHIRTSLLPGEEHVYYRFSARGPAPLRVVSNPIFVRRQ